MNSAAFEVAPYFGIPMPDCTYCHSETELYDDGLPVCIECSDRLDSKPPSNGCKENLELRKAVSAGVSRVVEINAAMVGAIRSEDENGSQS